MPAIQQYRNADNTGLVNFPDMLVNAVMETPWRAPKVTHAFAGLSGVQEYLDYIKERKIICEVHLYGYETENALNTDLLAIESETHNLVGAPIILANTYTPSTFDGIEYTAPKRYCPHQGYHRRARLMWTQRTTPSSSGLPDVV